MSAQEWLAHVWLGCLAAGVVYLAACHTDRHFWRGAGYGLLVALVCVATVVAIGVVAS